MIRLQNRRVYRHRQLWRLRRWTWSVDVCNDGAYLVSYHGGYYLSAHAARRALDSAVGVLSAVQCSLDLRNDRLRREHGGGE